jgi:hypothetical protein
MKKGDKVKVIKGVIFPRNGKYYSPQNAKIGDIVTLKEDFSDSSNGKYWIFEEQHSNGLHDKWAFEFQLELVDNLEEIKKEAYKKGYEDARIEMTNKWYSENLYTEGMLKTKIEDALSHRDKRILDWAEEGIERFDGQGMNNYLNGGIDTLISLINFIKY